MRLQVELQQLEKSFGIQHRHRKMQSALVGTVLTTGKQRDSGFLKRIYFLVSNSCIQLQPDTQLIGCQCAGSKPAANLLDHAVQHKCQWLQKADGVFEFERLLKFQKRLSGDKRARDCAASQLL